MASNTCSYAALAESQVLFGSTCATCETIIVGRWLESDTGGVSCLNDPVCCTYGSATVYEFDCRAKLPKKSMLFRDDKAFSAIMSICQVIENF